MEPLPPEAVLANAPPTIAAIGERLREIVKRTVPDALERVRPGWGLIGYDAPNGRRTAYFAWIWPETEHCHLGFQQGWAMRDPHGRLQGAGITKQVRWLTFDPGDDIDEAACRELLFEALEVARMGRGERELRAASAGDDEVLDLDRPPADWPRQPLETDEPA